MSVNLFSLEGRVALVCGGSKGLGRSMAEAFAGAGAEVALVSRDAGRLESTAEELRAGSQRPVHALAGDMTVAAEVERVVGAVTERAGRLDILVNSVGVNVRDPLLELSERDWHMVIDTNLTSCFLTCKAVGPHMVGQGFGRVINIGSVLSSFALPGRTAYCSSKGGVLQFTRTVALEWAGHNVTANAISPGFFATELNEPVLSNPDVYRQLCAKIPLGRFAEPDEIKTAALFLASPASGYVTGSVVHVDAGVTAAI